MSLSPAKPLSLALALSLAGAHLAHATPDPLSALLAQAQSSEAEALDPHGDEAAVTFLLLTPKPLSEAQLSAAQEAGLKGALTATARWLKTFKEVKGLTVKRFVKALNVSYQPIDQDFPLNLEALAAASSSPESAAQVQQSKGALFVSYRGPALKGAAQLSMSCEALQAAQKTLQVAELDSTLLFSLGALAQLNPQALKAQCAAVEQGEQGEQGAQGEQGEQGELKGWARPDIEQLEDGALRLVTRGLSQLGRAELELGPLSRDEARAQWGRFLGAFEASLTGPTPKADSSLSLSACQRPEHSYEGRCARLTFR